MSYRLIDLFSGAGGMSLGFAREGIESILALDNDAAAIGTHKANFPGEAYCANIEDWLETAEVPEADVVIGGPPCQGFSLLNKKRDQGCHRQCRRLRGPADAPPNHRRRLAPDRRAGLPPTPDPCGAEQGAQSPSLAHRPPGDRRPAQADRYRDRRRRAHGSAFRTEPDRPQHRPL